METVVVVHGLWMHGVIMWCLARRIARCGFDVKVYSYPSMRLSLTDNAARLAAYCASLGVARVHLVAHSLGGLVALKMLASGHEVRCGRMVLLGTPSGGSFAARRLNALPGGAALLGRSIGEWLRQTTATPAHVPAIGIIAGTRSVGLGQLVAPDLPKPNDGVVALEETTVAGTTRRVTLKVAHSSMLFSRVVAGQCCAFLRHGSFEDTAE